MSNHHSKTGDFHYIINTMNAYHTNPQRYLSQRYSDILTRTEGKDKKTGNRVKDLPVGFTRQQFISWAIGSPDFKELFDNWDKAGFTRASAPSIERFDSDLGYVPGNVGWVTHRDNSKLGGINAGRILHGLKKITRAEFEQNLAVA